MVEVGRPKLNESEKKKREVIYLEPDLLEWAKEKAKEDRRTLSQYISILLDKEREN